MADALDELDARVRKSRALKRIVAATRLYPDIWDRGPGAYSSYPKVIRMWRAMEAALEDARPHRRDKFAAWLISTAREFIVEEDERLAAACAYVTGTPEWKALPRSARRVYEVLHAVAAEQGQLGGPRVEMCHTLAIELVHARTGLRRCSKGTVTNAREALVQAGFIEAHVGEPWTKGIKSRATIYDLLPDNLRKRLAETELSHGSSIGIVQFSRPRLSGSERDLVMRTIAALSEDRRQQERDDTMAEARDSMTEFGHLIGVSPEEPDTDFSAPGIGELLDDAAAEYQEGDEDGSGAGRG
jgi:hypothetical protein